MPGGRPRTVPAARCPRSEHRDSVVYASGTYETGSGLRQRYRCTPLVGPRHQFSVVVTTAEPARRRDEPPPACPRGHTGVVHRNGTYGTRVQEPRQMYRCLPSEEDFAANPWLKPHKFAAVLPRDHVHEGNQDCKVCEELRGIHRGETTIARRHSWSTRVVVRGLEQLAAGKTYVEVSQWALRVEGGGVRTRKKPDRDPDEEPAGRPNPGQRWHIAADWTEAFSPVIWDFVRARMDLATARAQAAGAQVVWLIDSTSFGGRRRIGDGLNGGVGADRFALLSIAEAFVGGSPSPLVNRETRLRLTRALPNRTAQAWQLVLAEPGYAPDVIVSDADAAQLGALAALFPQTVFVPCLYHLRRRLEEGLADLPGAFTGTGTSRALHPTLREHLAKMTKRADIHDEARIREWWDGWEQVHAALRVPTDRLERQRDRYEQALISASVNLAEHPDVPLSVGALEAMQATVLRPAFAGRAAAFGNVERTNCLLDLIVARQRHVFDDLNAVADLLRADALTDRGHTTPLRWVQDPQPKRNAYSSLRDPALVLDLAEQRGFL